MIFPHVAPDVCDAAWRARLQALGWPASPAECVREHWHQGLFSGPMQGVFVLAGLAGAGLGVAGLVMLWAVPLWRATVVLSAVHTGLREHGLRRQPAAHAHYNALVDALGAAGGQGSLLHREIEVLFARQGQLSRAQVGYLQGTIAQVLARARAQRGWHILAGHHRPA